MQLKISKTLEGIIARVAFNTTKAGTTHSLKDFLTLELLREEGSLAYQLLSSRLKDWELYQVCLRIEREIAAPRQPDARTPEEFYRHFTEELLATPTAAKSVSTAHALQRIAEDRSTATARVLEMYGVNAETIARELRLSRSTVQRALNDLYRAGFLEKQNRRRPNGSLTSNFFTVK